ncbi:phage tail tube protein [Deinococcus metallilatus]|uniref:Repeat protein (TIGR01451 family) n=2 Tax=Deinococcus metallilatus TaxID=1211322 RepID=A0ABR6MUG1_9DEIO|nr:phage tail tube protein [Deinococcus metallilatus]MBB5295573.1 putative repeat protein (TIGR01451 family) [Deinococcus metallilatus]GMA16252.1 hypothetical protein GCM10025871_25830 [Deinococcus metallilatus]
MNAKIGIIALTSVLLLAACGGNPAPVAATEGSVSVPTSTGYTVVIKDANGNVIPSSDYNKLKPGTYTATYSKEGYISQTQTFTVTAGQTTNLVVPTLLPVGATVGTVSVQNPNGYMVVIKDAGGNTVTSDQYGNLKPGTYTVTYSKEGYVSQTQTFTVTAGQSVSLVAPTLVAVTPTTPSGAFYIDANGKQVAITKDDLDNAGTRFVFYAWLENKDGGIDPSKVGGNTDAGMPTAAEMQEVAPLNTQNLAAGYVGYRAADGQVYPIVGANVKWDILEQTGSVRFSAADDGTQASGAPISKQDINDNALSANTYTNSAGGNNVRFPSSREYPLYNVTGVNTPDITGFTWTALNHDPKFNAATARVRAIASVNGTEITKRFLDKTFAPSAKLEIVKEANQTVGLNQDGSFTVTVRNVGQGPATGIQLQDRLTSGSDDTYSIGAVTANGAATTTAQGDSGFNSTFDLAPGEARTFTFPARSSAVGVFCDTATVTQYTNGAFGVVSSNLNDDACLTVQAPELTITKSLVDANNNPIPSGQQVGPNQEVFAAITVRNGGSAPATNVVVTDNLISGAAASYAIRTQAQGTTANGDDGFTSDPFTLAPGETRTFRFGAVGTQDGTYCDTGSFTATSNNGQALNGTSQQACFEVVSPNLSITKVNQNLNGTTPVNNLYPGSSYQSVITVRNTGTGAATTLAVQDILGKLQTGTQYVNFGSGRYSISGTDQTGSVTFANNTVTTVPASLTLNPGQTLTLTLTSTIPAGAPAGTYCDVASYTSGNGGNGQAQDCVNVVNFVSTQTQMVDANDPINANGTDSTVLTSSLIVEPQSNEGVNNNMVAFNFGSTDPRALTPGVFNVAATELYYDPTPVRDPQTGAVNSDYTHSSSQRLTEGTDYTLSGAAQGTQTVNLTSGFAIQPGGVLFLRHTVTVPAGTAPRQYYSGFNWTGRGVNDGQTAGGASSEPTSVVNQ